MQKFSFYFGGIDWHQNGQHLTFYELPWQAIPFIKYENLPYFFINLSENGTASPHDLIFYDSKDEKWRVIKVLVF